MKNTILLILLLNFSCSSPLDIKLEEDTDVLSIYNKKEISSLKLIVDFYDAFIMKNTKQQQINLAYHEYFESIRNVNSFEDLINHIRLTPDDLKFLINDLKICGTFDEIWQYEYGINYKTKDTISVCIIPNTQGKYMRLLKLLGQSNDYLEVYANSIQECVCIPPSIAVGFQHNHNEFDFQKEVNRLIFAIHYITIISEEKYKK